MGAGHDHGTGEIQHERPLWWAFGLTAAFLIADVLYSALLGVLGASCLWSIGELFEQKERCEKGWFPKNPKLEKKGYYKS